jgi:hypothetical protein
MAALLDESTIADHLGHAAGHKTADPYAVMEPVILIAVDIDWPDHCPPDPVRLSHDGTVWHDNPQHVLGTGNVWYANAIVTVFGLPVGIFHDTAVGIRTAASPAAFELVKPRLEWGLRIMSVQIAPKCFYQPHSEEETD